MSKHKDSRNTTFKTPLLNDCTNHLAFQLKQNRGENTTQQTKSVSSYETPIADIVTHEFVRGYN